MFLHAVDCQELVGVREAHLDQVPGEILVEQVGEAQSAARGLVGVGRADPPPGGSDRELPASPFLGLVQVLVIGEHHVGAIRNEEILRCDDDPLLLEGLDLLHQSDRVEDDPVPDHVQLAWPEDTGRDEVQDVFPFTHDHGVPGIVSALSANHQIRRLGQEIDDLALSFVAPLEAVDDTVHGFGGRWSTLAGADGFLRRGVSGWGAWDSPRPGRVGLPGTGKGCTIQSG